MTTDVPLGKQRHFTLQQRAIIRRQYPGPARALPGHQRRDGVAEKRIRAGFRQRVQISGVAEIRQQQETAFDVRGQHRGHMQAGLPHQLRHLHEGAAVFALRRRIHRDPRAGGQRDTEITTEAGVGGCRRQSECGSGQRAGKPRAERFEALVAPGR